MRTRTFDRPALLFALTAVASLGAPSEASACGGCFGPTQTVQVVTDHRMVMAIHSDESILWDQIRFTGRPEDFSWVLPVRGDVQVMTASGAFFDQLDAATAPVLRAPPSPCASASSRGGFGSSSRPLPTAANAEDSGSVQVIRTEVVGPYQSVLIRSTDADALAQWLRSNGYSIPPAIEPVIRWYNDMHMDFYAMRLRPGEGVQAMQPVRVRFATPSPVLPLRMIAAGAAEKVGINLVVVGEGRWETQNFPTRRIDPAALVWDWAASTSNYNSAFRETVAAAGGRAWIVEAALGAGSFQWRLGGEAASDWAVAARGLSNPWVTRLRADLAVRFLDQDLQLAASDDTSPVSNFVSITRSINAPRCINDDGFYGGTDGAAAEGLKCSSRPGGARGNGLALAALALAAIAARRSRKTP